MDYNIILTDKGKAKIAAAIANSTTIELKKIAFGDGNGSVYMPTATATALKKKKYATDLNSVTIHPDNKNWIVCEGYIPTDEGDFWIREIGVFDEAGDLIAIGNYPETYKPLLTLGIGTDLVLRVVMEVSDASVVNLTIDPSLTMATQEWVKEEIKKNPSGTYIGMLSSSTRRDLPAGWIRLDGATYTQETFPQFYALLEGGKFPTCTAAQYSSYLSTQKGSCGFFVLDTSAKTFRVPTITDGAALTQALTTGELTKFYEGAIENIKGFFEAQTYPGCDNVDGQLFRKTYAGRANRNTNDTSYRFDFDASRVVATASETRTRQIRYPFVMCIAHAGEKEVSEVIWNGFLAALGNKADNDLNNTPLAGADYVIETVRTDKTWCRKYKSGWVEQGGGPTRDMLITLPAAMANASYYCSASWANTSQDGNWDPVVSARPNSVTQLRITTSRDQGHHLYWEVKGMGA